MLESLYVTEPELNNSERTWLDESMGHDASCHHVLPLPGLADFLKHTFRSWNMVTLFLGTEPHRWREASLYP